ncbi:MAG TPA: glycoside hydrolase family 30 beta sandwich domain-containing protein [Mobilitalea sp.]|nr:glycoside hydrolase family 30 beta sandwich domain-containing protein [Mobilitalea sp.]
MKFYVTNQNMQFAENELSFKYNAKSEMKLIKVYPEEKRQNIIGIGGALTESSAYIFSEMSDEKKEELLKLYFGSEGNQYNFCRLHIQSCDFSLGNRAYVVDGDKALQSFSIEEDYKYQIPFIKAALEKNKELTFLASPWSPPGFMKTNNEMNHGGKLLEEYYDAWAEIMVRYVLEYQKEGINITHLTIQNEPAAVQTWDSCLYSPEDEKIFACDYLRKKLDAAGLKSIKLNIWDHNKDLILDRAKATLSDQKAQDAISGIAFHWYSGDHFEALQCVRERFPDKELIFTEGCVEYSRFANSGQSYKAEMYAHDMIGNFKAGMNGFIDWNVILDEKGGPNHVGNYCDAPIMCNAAKDEIDVKLSYYYIGHFSRFVKPGAQRILVSSYTDKLEAVGFVNPDGEIVLVVLNKTEEKQEFELYRQGETCKIVMEEHSILTACWKEDKR